MITSETESVIGSIKVAQLTSDTEYHREKAESGTDMSREETKSKY